MLLNYIIKSIFKITIELNKLELNKLGKLESLFVQKNQKITFINLYCFQLYEINYMKLKRDTNYGIPIQNNFIRAWSGRKN